MLVKHSDDCVPFVAIDGCTIRELLHPAHGDCELPYSFALAEVGALGATFPHRLDRTEVYFVLQGRGRLHIDGEAAVLETGAAAIIPAGATQWIENLGEAVLRFAAIVSPPWSAAGDERVQT
jgi:mannose-6-phosphate isomerase-like protein (cupin superfamily)